MPSPLDFLAFHDFVKSLVKGFHSLNNFGNLGIEIGSESGGEGSDLCSKISADGCNFLTNDFCQVSFHISHYLAV